MNPLPIFQQTFNFNSTTVSCNLYDLPSEECPGTSNFILDLKTKVPSQEKKSNVTEQMQQRLHNLQVAREAVQAAFLEVERMIGGGIHCPDLREPPRKRRACNQRPQRTQAGPNDHTTEPGSPYLNDTPRRRRHHHVSQDVEILPDHTTEPGSPYLNDTPRRRRHQCDNPDVEILPDHTTEPGSPYLNDTPRRRRHLAPAPPPLPPTPVPWDETVVKLPQMPLGTDPARTTCTSNRKPWSLPAKTRGPQPKWATREMMPSWGSHTRSGPSNVGSTAPAQTQQRRQSLGARSSSSSQSLPGYCQPASVRSQFRATAERQPWRGGGCAPATFSDIRNTRPDRTSAVQGVYGTWRRRNSTGMPTRNAAGMPTRNAAGMPTRNAAGMPTRKAPDTASCRRALTAPSTTCLTDPSNRTIQDLVGKFNNLEDIALDEVKSHGHQKDAINQSVNAINDATA